MIHPDALEEWKQKNKKPTFNDVVQYFHSIVKTFPDKRTGDNKKYKMEDVALGGFSVFFTQCPSFLAHQKAIQKAKGLSNAQSLFKMSDIPTDTHIRNLLDEVSPTYVFPVFEYVYEIFNTTKILDSFRSFNENLLLPLDGVHYHSSHNIYGDCCNKKHHKNGNITYFHSVVAAAIVKPGCDKVIALQPEFITPQDGEKKEDCENAAGKRWLNKYGQYYSKFGVTILGDDLYCKQPLVKLILKKGFSFILTCKPDSHTTLYEYLEFLSEDIQTVEIERWEGKTCYVDTYRFYNGVPLRDGEDAKEVNWCELTTTRKHDEKIVYKNAFATNFTITEENVIEIVRDGRARWKIENENNNVLKTKGYNLEHNFGHGKKHLSTLLFTFNILAFLFHTLLDFFDEKYKLVRQNLPTRKTFFEHIRALTTYICFKNWNHLMIFMLEGLELEIPD